MTTTTIVITTKEKEGERYEKFIFTHWMHILYTLFKKCFYDLKVDLEESKNMALNYLECSSIANSPINLKLPEHK